MLPVCFEDRYKEFYAIQPRTKTIAFAIAIILALSALLVGILAHCNFDPFGGIGTIGSKVSMYGGTTLLFLAFTLKMIDNYCCRTQEEEEPKKPTPSQTEPLSTLPVVTEAPKSFPFLDDIRLQLELPKVLSLSDKEFFKREPSLLLKGILNGSYQNLRGTGIEHPTQLPPVFEYISKRIQHLNSQIDEKISEEIPDQKILEEVCTIWSQLLGIYKDPTLNLINLAQLKECAEKLPHNPKFYKDFIQVHIQLQNLISAILSKSIDENVVLAEVSELFTRKLEKEPDSEGEQ